MPSAPTLNRPPRQTPARPNGELFFGTTFSRPPLPRQTPISNVDRNALTGAAIGTSTRPVQVSDGVERFGPGHPAPAAARALGSAVPTGGGRPSGGAAIGPPPGIGPRPNTPNTPLSIGLPGGRPPAPGTVMTTTPMRGRPIEAPGQSTASGAITAGGPEGPTGASTFTIPLVPEDEIAKAQAVAEYGNTASGALAGMGNAALAYGDPSLMGQWGLKPTANPNSALAMAALRAQQQQQAAQGNRERAGTFFSSLMGQDLSNIAGTQQRAQLAGYTRYQNALARFNAAMTAAAEARDRAINQANLDERQSAINNLPTAQTTGSGGFNPGSPSVTSRTPKPGTVRVPGAPTLKGAKGNKTTKAGRPASSRVPTNKPSAVGKVKTGVRRVSGGRRGRR